uniref:Transmembrane protein n=1 Tax=Macrostomum lignano TaxID=282301 RepID=A0A1I8G749_9PLAT
MPASDSEPQRQVVYEPCVRPSELLRRQRLPTEASAEQPTGCWPATRQLLRCWRRSFICMLFLFVKLSFCLSPQHPSRWHQCQSCRSHRRRRLPSRLHPQPRGFCSSSAGGSRLRDSRGRAAVAAGPAVTAASSGRVATHSAVGATSDVVRRLCAVADSPGRPRARRRGFYNGFRVAGELLLLLLSVPLLLLLLHCLLLLSGIGGQPALLQADWLQFLKFFEGLV